MTADGKAGALGTDGKLKGKTTLKRCETSGLLTR